MKKAPLARAVLFVSPGIIGQPENVVYGHIVEIGETDENIRGNVPLTQLVVAVCALRAIEIVCHFPLLQVSVFPKVAEPLIHRNHPCILYHSPVCAIDF